MHETKRSLKLSFLWVKDWVTCGRWKKRSFCMMRSRKKRLLVSCLNKTKTSSPEVRISSGIAPSRRKGWNTPLGSHISIGFCFFGRNVKVWKILLIIRFAGLCRCSVEHIVKKILVIDYQLNRILVLLLVISVGKVIKISLNTVMIMNFNNL